jgi:hypothetical protein
MVSVTPQPHFTPGEMTPGTHRIGGWVGLRAGLTEARGKISCLYRGTPNADRPVGSQDTLLTELRQLLNLLAFQSIDLC